MKEPPKVPAVRWQTNPPVLGRLLGSLASELLAIARNPRVAVPLYRFKRPTDGVLFRNLKRVFVLVESVKLFAKVPYHHYDAGRLDEGVRMLKGLRNMVVEAIVVLWEG